MDDIVDNEDEEIFEDEESFDPASAIKEEEDYLDDTTTPIPLRKGVTEDFYIVHEYTFQGGDDWKTLLSSSENTKNNKNRSSPMDPERLERLQLSATNVSLPVALMMVDPAQFPSLSRARKIIRRRNVLVERGGGSNSGNAERILGTVAERVVLHDRIGIQQRMGNGSFTIPRHGKPPFDVPVVYQDDHMALVNKPAGVVTYRQGSASGLMSVRAALPFCLQPPSVGTVAVLRRPASVHRLDKPTSGVMCVVKTKPAMRHLSEQFRHRMVKKTYMAIVNGIPEERMDAYISCEEARDLGVDVDPANYAANTRWQVVRSQLDDKEAVTVWRAVRYAKSLHAHDGYLTLVELKPKTGRFHQLRRHLAWECGRPIVGDAKYDQSTDSALKFRSNGLFLCANAVTLEHPFYNTKEGRAVWETMKVTSSEKKNVNDGILWYSEENNRVMVSGSVDLPEKFGKLLAREEDRYERLNDVCQ